MAGINIHIVDSAASPALLRRAEEGDVTSLMLWLCANCPERWKLDAELLPLLIGEAPGRWAETSDGYRYNAAAA